MSNSPKPGTLPSLTSPMKVSQTSERLLQPPKRKPLPEIPPSQKLSKVTQKMNGERLCFASVAQKKKKIAEAEMAVEKARRERDVNLSAADCDAMVQRVYYGSKSHEADLGAKLQSKYVTDLCRNTKVLTTSEINDSSVRLYDEPRRARTEMRGLLVDKYINDVAPKFVKMTKEEMAQSALRLTSKKK